MNEKCIPIFMIFWDTVINKYTKSNNRFFLGFFTLYVFNKGLRSRLRFTSKNINQDN